MEFYAGSEHTAKAVMHNPTSKAFDYQGVLFMGANQAAMAEKDFHLVAGESKEVSFPITMPTALGDYPVYIGVFSGGIFLEPLRQGVNVAIVAQTGPFNMSITKIDTKTDPRATAYWIMEPTALISNPHSFPVTRQLRFIVAPGSYDRDLLSSYIWTRYWGSVAPEYGVRRLTVTLNPGESVTLVSPYYYVNGWHPFHKSYLWSNSPSGMHSGGVRKKYWFRIIDELGNWSSVMSVGTRT